jgi:putative DNA primase/helicase
MPDGLHRYDVLGEFRDSFAAAGLVAPAEIIADGNYHRCDVIGKRPRNNAGRYKVYLDRWPAGVLQNFVESSLEIWHPKSRGHKPSADERSERKRYYEEKRAEAEADLADEQARVAITAEWRWSSLVEAVETPYKFRKHIGAHGARKTPYGTDLYVSVRDVEGKLWCLQEIRADGKKLFPRNARVKGCFHVIGEVADGWPLQIAEGFATGASAFEANGIATVIAFYSGNLLHVTKGLRERYPNSPITILADDDAETERRIGKNPGIEAAVEAAIAVGGKMAVPQFGADRAEKWSDFNDVHISAGLKAVREQIATAHDPVERAYPAPAELLTVEEARAQLDRILNGFMRIAPTWSQTWPRTEEGYLDLNKDAPAYCISMPPGLGKTTGILERVIPAALKAGRTILIAVPRHKLGKQLVDDLATLGVRARVYQSRGAADLEKPGQPMCPEIERVEAIQGALGEVSRLACKSAKGICDKFETCGYQRQQRPPEPQLWIIPHQNLFFCAAIVHSEARHCGHR